MQRILFFSLCWKEPSGLKMKISFGKPTLKRTSETPLSLSLSLSLTHTHTHSFSLSSLSLSVSIKSEGVSVWPCPISLYTPLLPIVRNAKVMCDYLARNTYPRHKHTHARRYVMSTFMDTWSLRWKKNGNKCLHHFLSKPCWWFCWEQYWQLNDWMSFEAN